MLCNRQVFSLATCLVHQCGNSFCHTTALTDLDMIAWYSSKREKQNNPRNNTRSGVRDFVLPHTDSFCKKNGENKIKTVSSQCRELFAAENFTGQLIYLLGHIYTATKMQRAGPDTQEVATRKQTCLAFLHEGTTPCCSRQTLTSLQKTGQTLKLSCHWQHPTLGTLRCQLC